MKKIVNFFKKDANRLFILVAGIVITFFLMEAVYYIFFLNTWFDEANFVYKSWLNSQDMAWPFQDFRSKYPPVAFYSQMIWQGMFGPSLLAARILSALFLAGMAWLIFDICKKMGNRWIGLAGSALLIFHPYLVGKYISAAPYSMAMFFILLSIWFLDWNRIKDWQKILMSSLAMALAMLVRYNLFPTLIILWFFIFFYWRNWKYFIVSVTASLGIILIVFIPYAMLDFEYALARFLIMFGPLAKFIPLDYFQLADPFVAKDVSRSFFSLLSSNRLKILIDLFIKYFHLLIIFTTVIFLMFQKKIKDLNNFFRCNSILTLVFFLTVILFAIHFLGFKTAMIYSLYFLPLLIISVAGIINLFYKYLEEKSIWNYIGRYLITFFIITLISATISVGLSGPDIIFFNHFNYQDSDLNRVKRGAEYLKSITSRDDIILTIDDPHHILMAGRYVIPPLINMHHTYIDFEDNELLDRYKLYNKSIFISWLEDTATVVVFQRDRLDEMIGIKIPIKDGVAGFQNILDDKFELVGSIENIYPRKTTRGNGVMEIYRRK